MTRDGAVTMTKEYRVIWRLKSDNTERFTVWYKSEWIADNMAESIKEGGFIVVGKQIRDAKEEG